MDEQNYLKWLFNARVLLALFLAFIFAWLVKYLYHFDITAPQGYVLGDWLINYQDGGFKRRGLSGSMFFFLQDASGVKLQNLVFSFQLILYFVFFIFLFRILYSRKISIYYFTLIVSPLTFLFYINDVESVGKKELFIFVIFAYFVYILSENKLNKVREIFIWLLIFTATLFHEIVFFYIPYFILALIYFNRKIEIKKYMPYFLASFIPVILIVINGAGVNEGKSIALLLQRGVDFSNYGQGVFIWPDGMQAIAHATAYYKFRLLPYLLYFISIVIGCIHFTYFVVQTEKKLLKHFIISLSLIFLFTLPLFYLAIDWGRWIHIHFVLLLIIFAAILPKIEKEEIWGKSILSNIPQIKYLLLIPISIMWAMPSYGLGFLIKNFDMSLSQPAFLQVAKHQARSHPTANTYFSLGMHHYKLEQHEKSIASYQKAVKYNPDFADAYNNICYAYIKLEKWDNAIEACNKALEINPFYTLAATNKMWATEQKNQFGTNTSPSYYLGLSLEYYNLGLYEKSIEACKEALKINPEYAPAYNNICASYINLGDYNKAIEACDNALKYDPEYELARNNKKWAMGLMHQEKTN